METLSPLILPILLIGFILCLGKIRTWAETLEANAKLRSGFIDQYNKEAMHFLKLTNHDQHETLRDAVVILGEHMLRGTSLVRLVLSGRKFETYKQMNLGRRKSPKLDNKLDKEFSNLPDEALHALGAAIGSALMASTFQSLLLGSILRAALSLGLNSENNELTRPKDYLKRIDFSHWLESRTVPLHSA